MTESIINLRIPTTGLNASQNLQQMHHAYHLEGCREKRSSSDSLSLLTLDHLRRGSPHEHPSPLCAHGSLPPHTLRRPGREMQGRRADSLGRNLRLKCLKVF